MAALEYIDDRMRDHSDARNIIKGLVTNHGATLMHPGYRTALRCCGIYTEAAAWCDLVIAKNLLTSFTTQAEIYLRAADSSDLFVWAGSGADVARAAIAAAKGGAA